MERWIIVMTCLGLVACVPPAKDAGEFEPVDGADSGSTTLDRPGGSDDGATSTSGAPDEADSSTGVPDDGGPPGPEWTMLLSDNEHESAWLMLPSPNGVVLVLQYSYLQYSSVVMEISAQMEVLWTVSLPGAWISGFSRLPDGGYVAGGTVGILDDARPTAWRLSCCGSLELSHEFDVPDVPGWIPEIEPHEGGLLVVVEHEFEATVMRTDLEFDEIWTLEMPEFNPRDAALTPSGDVVLSGLIADRGRVLREIAPDGTVTETAAASTVNLVGAGDDLSLMWFDGFDVELERYDGSNATTIEMPEFQHDAYVADRRGLFAFARKNALGQPGGPIELTELDETGAIMRRTIDTPMFSTPGRR